MGLSVDWLDHLLSSTQGDSKISYFSHSYITASDHSLLPADVQNSEWKVDVLIAQDICIHLSLSITFSLSSSLLSLFPYFFCLVSSLFFLLFFSFPFFLFFFYLSYGDRVIPPTHILWIKYLVIPYPIYFL
jgi:hypothetical protein